MSEKTLLQEAETYKSYLTETRHYLHSHPEIGFDLTETTAFVKKELISMGYEPTACGKSGITVLAGGQKTGKVFLIRGDMDALPITEESDVDFKSQNGNMHACGHDMHTTMLLGAAKLLKLHEDEILGTVKLMFQPAEEIFEGSKDMLQAGLLEHPKVDAALMIHVMAGMPLPEGTTIVCNGGVSAPAADYFTIKIQGKGCHGSMPNTGVDPVNIAAHTAATFRGEAKVTFGSGCPTLINDAALSQCVVTYLKDLLGTGKAFTAGELNAMSGDKKASKTAGSEDFAYVSHKVPSIMLALAAGQPKNGYCFPQHHPKVKFNEDVLPVGSAIYAYTAIEWLRNHK